MARLRDHQFGLGAQIAAAIDLPLLFLAFVVEHVVHLVVDHVVAELFAVRALVFCIALLTLVKCDVRIAYLAARTNCFLLLERRHV